jgi:prevent-host-death family protein
MPAGKFKAQCLAVLDRVAEKGEIVIVTKRGKPVAKIVPIERQLSRTVKRSVKYCGDIVGQIDATWDADR